jgi:hypothetical protein
MKLGDEIVELKDCDAVRVPPGTWRGYERRQRRNKKRRRSEHRTGETKEGQGPMWPAKEKAPSSKELRASRPPP